MSKNLQIVLRCAGIALAALLIWNSLAFLYTSLTTDLGDNWIFQYKHGAFTVNGTPVGLPWGEMRTTLFVLMMFLWLLSRNYRQGNFE